MKADYKVNVFPGSGASNTVIDVVLKIPKYQKFDYIPMLSEQLQN